MASEEAMKCQAGRGGGAKRRVERGERRQESASSVSHTMNLLKPEGAEGIEMLLCE